MFRKTQTLPILIACAAQIAATVFSGCEKKTPPPVSPAPAEISSVRETPPERVTETSPDALLASLHHAAQEMALDGFQFDKKHLGWPRDRGSQSASAHLQALVDHGYLAAADIAHFADIDIANLGDSDPGESAFAKIPTRGGILVIRKDGQILNAPANPDPAWLPR